MEHIRVFLDKKLKSGCLHSLATHSLSVHIITENASTVSNSDEVSERNRDSQMIPDLMLTIELYGHVSGNHRNKRIRCHNSKLPLNENLITLNTFNPSLLYSCPCSP